MNKIKLFIASMLGAIALVFACVLGTKVNAATSNYQLDLTRITTTTDKAVLTNDTLNNSFLNVETEYCTARYKKGNYCIEIVNSALSVTFQGTGTITVTFCSTGGGNESHFGLTDSKNSVLSASSATATLLTSGDDSGYYTVTGTSTLSVTYSITAAGKYYLSSPNGVTNRGCRVYAVTMSDTYGAVTYHTVTYMDGENVLKEDSLVVDGDSATYVPAKNGYKFLGWYTDSNLATAYENEAITADKTLYAKFFDLSTGTTVLNASTMENGTISESTYVSGSIFSIMADSSATVAIDEHSKTIDGHSFTKRFKLGGTGKATSRSILVEAPSKGFLRVYGMSSSSSNVRTLGLYNESYAAIDDTSFSNDGKDIGRYTFEISNAGSYYLGSTNGGFNLYYIEFVTEAADFTTLKFDAQYDADGTAATKLRFIGTIEGLATTEYTMIETITFTFDFNGADDRALSVTQLYLSITGYDQYKAASNKMYFVYQLDNINKKDYASKTLTDCKLTVVFTDGSSKTTTHDDITLPAFA